jgi:hypothetical protein
VSLLDEEERPAAECRQYTPARYLVKQIPSGWFTHTVTGWNTKMESLTVSAT